MCSSGASTKTLIRPPSIPQPVRASVRLAVGFSITIGIGWVAAHCVIFENLNSWEFAWASLFWLTITTIAGSLYSFFRGTWRERCLLTLTLIPCVFMLFSEKHELNEIWAARQFAHWPPRMAFHLIHQSELDYFARHKTFAPPQEMARSDAQGTTGQMSEDTLEAAILKGRPWGLSYTR